MLINTVVIVFAMTAGTLSTVTAPTPWERYLMAPSGQNARHVSELSYSTRETPEAESRRLGDDLALLSIQVGAADREAVRLAFRLRERADGVSGETLDILLGRLIRVSPTLFLEELASVRSRLHRLDGLVGNFGPEYVDRTEAAALESQLRIAALQSVRGARLRAVRDQCVAELRR